MKTKDFLKLEIEILSNLKANWGGYNEDDISIPTIVTASKVIDTLPSFLNLNDVSIFPMRNGGIQINIGDFKEIEVLGDDVKEIKFDSNFNIINKTTYKLY
jgi:hypothetical protein